MIRVFKSFSSGQSFLEVIIVVAVVILMVSGLVVGTVTSLKTTNFASSKSQATKYAQEGIELARRERDASWYEFYSQRDKTFCVNQSGTFLSESLCSSSLNRLDGASPGIFTRIVQYTWNGSPGQPGEAPRMEVTVTVSWEDGSGSHKSQLSTFFTQWR
jgi:type II secretory pathway pseudopilin PulG